MHQYQIRKRGRQLKILVTGGAGFIGSNLVRRLLSDGVERVTVIDDFFSGFRSNLDGVDVEIIEGSILDPEALTRAAADAHAIVHLAARPSVPRSIKDPLASHHANATGSLAVLEAAARIPLACRVGVVILCLRCQPRPPSGRGPAADADQSLRREQVGRRVVRPVLPSGVRG
nr:NAD-dependent epimerase/dehydratase family protein [Auraticoccus monumenti]